jgi:hypothetical protein
MKLRIGLIRTTRPPRVTHLLLQKPRLRRRL